jgi:hypothetical protein
LCSITSSEWPAASSLRSARSSRDVVEVQAGGRLVEQEQRAARPAAALSPLARGLGEEAGELQALRLAARQRRHRLAEPQVVEADVLERLQHASPSRSRRRRTQRLVHRQSSTSATERSPPAVSLDRDLEDLGR